MPTLEQTDTVQYDSDIHWNSAHIGLLFNRASAAETPWGILENYREDVFDHKGQFISLDIRELQSFESPGQTLSEMFYTALKNQHWQAIASFRLPLMPKPAPHIDSEFLNQAILWQRLCDLLIFDDEPDRDTVLVLNHIDYASAAAQHEAARLIRFHRKHSLHRTFIITLKPDVYGQLSKELKDLIET